MTETLTHTYSDRAAAEGARSRLEAAGFSEARLFQNDDGKFAVTVPAETERRDEAREILEPGLAPRPVQPGFADARPGYIPEPTDIRVGTSEEAARDKDTVAQTKGRFWTQLDEAPDTPE